MMKLMKYIPCFVALLAGLLFLRCNVRIDMQTETQALLETDRAFALHSVEHGAAEAFRKYLLEDALQLPSGQLPMRGRETIYTEMLKSDGQYELNWEPREGAVAASGELGYTWGYYTVTIRGGEGDGQQRRGKYLNVWKKDDEGNWRVLVDTGNANPEDES